MPGIYDPSGVEGEIGDGDPGVFAMLRPPATFWQASGLRGDAADELRPCRAAVSSEAGPTVGERRGNIELLCAAQRLRAGGWAHVSDCLLRERKEDEKGQWS